MASRHPESAPRRLLEEFKEFFIPGLWVFLGGCAAAILLWKSMGPVERDELILMLVLAGVFLLRHYEAIRSRERSYSSMRSAELARRTDRWR